MSRPADAGRSFPPRGTGKQEPWLLSLAGPSDARSEASDVPRHMAPGTGLGQNGAPLAARLWTPRTYKARGSFRLLPHHTLTYLILGALALCSCEAWHKAQCSHLRNRKTHSPCLPGWRGDENSRARPRAWLTAGIHAGVWGSPRLHREPLSRERA